MKHVLRIAIVLLVFAGGVFFVVNGTRPLQAIAAVAGADASQSVVVADTKLDEISGCAVSVKNPGVLWVHNDSGDDAVLYALRLSDGVTLGKVKLKGISATDFEDMALAGDRLFVGDIGDNGAARKSISVHSVSEPKVNLKKVNQKWKLNPKSIALKYPSEARNAEAMIVDPNGAVVLVDKVDGTVWRENKKGQLDVVANLKIPLVTGAALVPGSNDVLIRTYPFVYRYAHVASTSFDTVWAAKPSIVTAPLLPQAEAVCASSDGKHGYTLSESRNQPVQIVPISW
jgi:hypothetical protein